jgi:hypothetical protein
MPTDTNSPRNSASRPVARRQTFGVTGFRRRQHGSVQQFDRCELERSGWRTTLDYQENHVRGRDGRLEQLHVVWRAEAERVGRDGVTQVVAASGSTLAKAWSRLRAEADLAEVRMHRDGPVMRRAPRRNGLARL